MKTSRRRAKAQTGFTLIELMVTLVIAAILLSVAIPAYNNQIRKGRRTDAKSALLDLASREERLLSTTNNYSSLASDLGYGPPGTPFPLSIGSGYYTIQAPAVTVAVAPAFGTTPIPPTYTITALPVGDQTYDAACQSFSVDNTGKQTATGSATASVDCWK